MSEPHRGHGKEDQTVSTSPDQHTNQPPTWRHSIRAKLDEHVFFSITLLLALYVVLFVPQVTNVWQQRPPYEGGFWTMLQYWLFLSFLIGFYTVSMFVVTRRFPVAFVQTRIERFVA